MLRVLIVDDHAEALYLLRRVLEAQGFGVVEAANGREALERARAQPVDLIVSDVLMPVMDGFSLCRAWKADPRLCSVPFVIYTATYVDQPDEQLALALGADLFLIKPLEPDVFMAHVRNVIARHQKGGLVARPGAAADGEVLRQYNEVLIHKLEDKLAQLESANQALRLKDLALASSRNGVVLGNPSGEVIYVNPPLLTMAGKAAAQVMGRPLRGVFDGPVFTRWLEQEEPPPLEIERRSATGLALWLRLEKHRVCDDGGAAVGLMLSCADVTQERLVRHDAARVQRLEALSFFAAGVAHDFNNLLMAIFSVLEMDDTRLADAEARRANRATAYAAFQRARELTRRLMSFAKHQPPERRPVDLRELLDESMALALSGSAIHCERRYAGEPVIASVDAGQLAQVFSNILVNARQAMQDRGRLVVSVREVATASGPSTVEVVVHDDGPGIPAEVLPNIFEPYFTTKDGGTGLGLATSRMIVSEHDGQLGVTSEPGTGTTFTVRLPSSDETPGLATPMPEPLPSRAEGRILVMDDEPAIQSLFRCGLERAGYTAVVTNSGEAAVRQLVQAKAEGRPFDLVILDLHVRDGSGGEQALADMRRLDPSLLAIATTSSGDTSTEALTAQGFARVIAKPFLVHELYATIKALLPRR